MDVLIISLIIFVPVFSTWLLLKWRNNRQKRQPPSDDAKTEQPEQFDANYAQIAQSLRKIALHKLRDEQKQFSGYSKAQAREALEKTQSQLNPMREKIGEEIAKTAAHMQASANYSAASSQQYSAWAEARWFEINPARDKIFCELIAKEMALEDVLTRNRV